ncbi:pyruvate dehydrogenase E1 component beta subunit [Ceratobasidium sp. AG-Ba]|nr:pyruvate dehydrogenase E1 component beta subunit [Ceratobasidium sp. AG-Ba]
MANSTVKGALHIHGQNPQFLVEKVIRTRIWESEYWKEQCFALTAESLIDKALELNSIGGVYGNQRPTHFISLLLKLLQIQPEKEILIEYLMAEEFKYLRALAAMYIRMTFPPVEVFELLEPLLKDYRKLRLRNMGGYQLTYMDEFVDQLLTEERVCDTILPRLTKREVLEETEGLAPRPSVLLDAMAGNASGSEDEDRALGVDHFLGLDLDPGHAPVLRTLRSALYLKVHLARVLVHVLVHVPAHLSLVAHERVHLLHIVLAREAYLPTEWKPSDGCHLATIILRGHEYDTRFCPRGLFLDHDVCSPLLPSSIMITRRAIYYRPLCKLAKPFSSTPRASLETAEPPPAGGHSSAVGQSPLLRGTREAALQTPGILWKDTEGDNGRETRKLNMYQSLREAMSTALNKDDTAVVFGEDVAFGGVFRCTMGLAEEFGKYTKHARKQFVLKHTQVVREFLTHHSQSKVLPVLALDSRPWGRPQSQKSSLPTIFILLLTNPSVMGVVVPRGPIQAKGLLLASIRDPNPVIFLEPKILYRSSVEQVPSDDFELPLGKAEVLTKGNDLTVVTYGSPVYTCENAISLLRNPPQSLAHLIPESVRKASIELIDLRTLLPWDVHTVLESVKKTGRLVIVHEAGKTMGPGAEIAAEITQRCFLNLHAPVKRIAGWDTPVGLMYEKFYIPDAVRVVDGIIETLKY